MSETITELEIKHNDKLYIVDVSFDTEWQDDSFDHEFGTEEVFSVSLDNDSLSVDSCDEVTEDGSVSVDADKVIGLYNAIVDKVGDYVSDNQDDFQPPEQDCEEDEF
jgi:hypothetical protein